MFWPNRVKYASVMSWKASARHGVREAPAGLALVQELLNTRASMSYGPDLLVLTDDAQRWLTDALGTWSRVSSLPAPILLLSSTDMRSLRRLRTTFENVVLAGGRAQHDGALPPADVPVSLVPDGDGWVRIVPAGRGTRWLASALWAEALLASRPGSGPGSSSATTSTAGPRSSTPPATTAGSGTTSAPAATPRICALSASASG